MVIQVLEIVTKGEERKRERLGSMQPNFSSVWHTGLSGGASDSVRCARLVSGETAALGSWRLSGESSAANSSLSRKALGRCGYNSPDCPESQRSLAPTVGRAIFARHVDCSNDQLVHWTVRCAPDSVRYANQLRGATIGYAKFGRRSHTGPSIVPVRWRTGLSGAPLDRRQELPSKIASNGS
jgi:hypothetical protein